MELNRRGAELLFPVLTEREEKALVAIAPSKSFSGWTKTVTDPQLCAAIWLIPQLAKLAGLSDEDLAGWVGTLRPSRAVRIQQAYPLAFFDLPSATGATSSTAPAPPSPRSASSLDPKA